MLLFFFFKLGRIYSGNKRRIHCLTTIISFSLLSTQGIEEIESTEFDAGEYKWKLIIYPDGDDKVNDADHISVHLSMGGTASLPAGWEFNAIVNIFLYNHISDNYLCFRGKARRFHAINHEWGIRKLMAKTSFTEPSNGYLSNDKCVFGAEVFVIKNRQLMENVYVLNVTDPYKREWKISDFSKQHFWISKDFYVGGFKWKIKLYPNGDLIADDRYISIYLYCVNFGAHKKVKATCLFTIRNMLQNQENHSGEVSGWFSPCGLDGWGLSHFMDLGSDRKGLFVNDCCVLDIQLSLEATLAAMKI